MRRKPITLPVRLKRAAEKLVFAMKVLANPKKRDKGAK
jgi:hypothetical protein